MKNSKAILFTAVLLILALMLSACSLPSGEKTPEPVPTEAPLPAESRAPQLCNNEPALSVIFSNEIKQMAGVESYTDSSGEYSNDVLFTAKRDIRDFRYYEISSELTESGDISINEEKQLYSREEMSEGDMLMISMEFEGYLPYRAISYVDDCGGTHYFYVTLSGEDNVPLLVVIPEYQHHI